MTMSEEAKREVELFKKNQDIYGQMCADSALRAFMKSTKKHTEARIFFFLLKTILHQTKSNIPTRNI